MQEVRVPARPFEPLAAIIGPDRADRLVETALPGARELLSGRTILNVNSTARGGGVAEMLSGLLGYLRSLDVDARWLVLDADPEFFTITKRLHNHLYGGVGDGGELGEKEHAVYESAAAQNIRDIAAVCRAGDVVILHDPQPAALACWFHEHGTHVVWRCHVGVDEPNEQTEKGWGFLRPYLEPYVEQYVFSRERFAPAWVPSERLHVIPPSLDPLSAKNRAMEAATVTAILAHVGVLGGDRPDGTGFVRSDGSRGRVDHYADLTTTGPPLAPDVRLVVQVSRWDRMKDMLGVMEGFARSRAAGNSAELLLAGPVVTSIADDPEAVLVIDECTSSWRELPHAIRSRIHLACLPMADLEENAAIVNALQRHATVVVQKSLAEGFGLTVAEAMYKGKPVIGSRVGGIADQLTHGETGLLLDDPTDLVAFARMLDDLLAHPAEATRMGEAARAVAIERFLPDRHFEQWLSVCESLLAS